MGTTTLRARLTDTAIEIARSWHHPTVEKRHVFAALVAEGVLDTESTETLLNLAGLLDPPGDADDVATITPEAELLLQRCSDSASAFFTAQELVEEYLAQQDQAQRIAAPADPVAPPTQSAPDPEVAKPDLQAILAELDDLVGLDEVKQTVRQLIALHQLNQARRARDLPVVPVSLHLVFTGNPGTGKTTVARLIAQIYCALGLLPGTAVREVSRVDLVAGYVGQTAGKVQEAVRSAQGGVLFVDEAYALASPSSEDFGNEAVATLVKLMEDQREHFAVIAAGYSEEMESFIEMNSGLRSRFSRFIEFPDYSDEELVEIVRRFAAEQRIPADAEVPGAVLAAVQAASSELRNGNARFARNLFERMYQRMAERIAADGTIGDAEVHAGFVAADVELP